MKNKEKISQNMTALIGRLGEDMVLFKMYALVFEHPELEVYKNYSETGYDIGIHNFKTNKRIKIEVKSRQHVISTSKSINLNTCHFTLTENEKNNSNFTVGYWIDENAFFIVPNEILKETNSKVKKVYKFVVSKLKRKNGEFSASSNQYLGNWDLILNSITTI